MTPPTGTWTPRRWKCTTFIQGKPFYIAAVDGEFYHPDDYAALETELATERARRESAEGALREVIPLGNDWEHTKFWEAHRKACAHFKQYGEGSNNGR